MYTRLFQKWKGIGMLMLVLLMAGCYPNSGGLTNEQSVIVVTEFDQEFNFGAQRTYYMPDTVAFVTNVEDPDIDPDQLARYEQAILSAVADNMAARSYTRILDSANPPPSPDNVDITVNVAAYGIRNTGTAWFPGWGWWWGYYPPGWGWGPGWGWYYPPGWGGVPVSYSYNTGTVIMNLASAEQAPGTPEGDNGLVPIHWTAFIDGMLAGVVENEDITRQINQAFDQSPYIQSNQ